MSACKVVALLPAPCFAGFVGWPLSSPPNGRLVLLLDVLRRDGRLKSIPVVPVALGRHGMLWWCNALMLGRALALLRLPLGGACPGGEKSFENRYDMPCTALEPALHARPVILYIAVPFSFPFGFACVDRIYTPVGGKAPSVLFGASPCSLWEPQSAVPVWWCGFCAGFSWPGALARSAGCWARCVPCCAVLGGSGGVCVGASGCRRSGWFGLVARRPLA